MGKQNKIGSTDVIYCEKYITWTDDTTEFMLQWYVDYQKDKPATFRWKQHHHRLCAEALNTRFGIGATRHQVYRHFRAFKEKWNWISHAMAKNGNGFDAASRKFNLPYSEKSPSKLGVRKYNYLTQPIKLFHHMEELFGESAQANGSLAVDQNTLDVEDDKSESGAEHIENDSDTIARSSPAVVETIAHSSPPVEDTIAHSSPEAVGFSSGMKRKNMKSPMKKHRKDKPKHAKALENDPIAGSIVMLAKSIAAPSDPYANLWKHTEDIPFPPRDKIDIASFLSKPEQVYLRNYLNAASDQSFGTWVTDYLGAKYSTSGV
uniref:Myb/SANT-like domain-containing protein n=1 Tax=Setaria italica TaxID=4555 RepID=K3Y1S2_SETIT